ncbi:MAG: hypothetical protein Q9217_000349 [Psora testacea]
MGFQKKTGKGRIDKWYRLAKEKGYRARAAFKLIQLNRKYGFLEKSRVLLDLCAAPGSWCQVATETMPAQGSIILGVDLAPINPIPRAITIQCDITTDKCRATIHRHLKTWKADTVLHDGAPNVGTAWVQDAFSQAELVLQALKLATDFLNEGGTFVTKIFRSKDYNALLWVFNQLFSKVEATKPPSSRNVSAEIFVVCQGFKAPKRIDPKFLDPKAVFAELSDPTPNNEAKVFNPEKKKRKREGYAEGDYTQFKEAPASEFIQTTDPIAMLSSINRLNFEQKDSGDIALAALDKLLETTDEVRQCCSDLRVLGRKDFRILLRWRLKARDIFGFATKKKEQEEDAGEEVAEITPMDEDIQIQEELERMNENETSRKKRERRRENERKQKEIIRMQLRMTTPKEIGLEQEGLNWRNTVFRLADVDKVGAIEKVAKGRMGVPVRTEEQVDGTPLEDESDEKEDKLDEELDALYNRYQERKSETDAKYLAKKARKEHNEQDFEGFSDGDKSSDEDFEQDSDESSEAENGTGTRGQLLFPKPSNFKGEDGLTRRAAAFFEQDIFKDIGGPYPDQDHDSAVDLDSRHQDDDIEGKGIQRPAQASTPSGIDIDAAQEDMQAEISSESEREGGDNAEESGDGAESETGFEIVKSRDTNWDAQSEPRKEGRLDIDIITAEAMTLAQQVASGQKTTQGLMDEGFNKYTFRDTDGLPQWFLDDENKHSKPQRPISASGAAAIKEKLRALNARPIKKVREAKDRKKFKAAQRLNKLRKKSALLAEEEGISEKDKAANIARIMSRAAKKKPKQQVKVVVAKGGNRGVSGRPRGVKGKYKIVDKRLKKDVRAEKRLAKKKR